MIRPAARVNLDMMCAFVVGAIDQQPTGTEFSHLAESDFLFAWHRIMVKATAPLHSRRIETV